MVVVSACMPPRDGGGGREILFHSDRSGTEEIFVMDPNGSNVRQLTHVGRSEVASIDADGSPDRKRIAFSSNRTGLWDDLYVMDRDGSNVRRLTKGAATALNPAWSPDGQRIAFQTYRDGTSHLYVINTDESTQRRLTDNPRRVDVRPTWSPDGREIVFNCGPDQHEKWEICLILADGSGFRTLTNNDAFDGHPDWW